MMDPLSPTTPDVADISPPSADFAAPSPCQPAVSPSPCHLAPSPCQPAVSPLPCQPAVSPSPCQPAVSSSPENKCDCEPSVTTEESLTLAVGMQFFNFTQAKFHIFSWAAARHVSLAVRDSRAEKDFPGLGKDFVIWICVHGGVKKPQGTGQRMPKKSPKVGCPFRIKLAGKNVSGSARLIVKEFVNEHNHPVTEEIFKSLPKNRRPKIDHALELMLNDNVPSSVICDYAQQTQGVMAVPQDIINLKKSLRKKWKSLRDQFCVEAGKMSRAAAKAGNKGDSPRKPKWRYFRRLMFLKDIIRPKSPFVGLNALNELPELSPEDDQRKNGLYMGCEEGVESSSSHMTDPQALEEEWEPNVKWEHFPQEDQGEPSRKRTRTDDYQPSISFEMEGQRHNRYFLDKPDRETEDDHDLMFFKTLLPHVKNIPENTKLTFRNCIQEIVQQFAYPSQSVPSTPQSQQSGTATCSPQGCNPSGSDHTSQSS